MTQRRSWPGTPRHPSPPAPTPRRLPGAAEGSPYHVTVTRTAPAKLALVLAWLIAVLIHGVFNLVAVLLVSSGLPNATLLTEGALLVMTIVLWAVFVLRCRPRFPVDIQPAPAR